MKEAFFYRKRGVSGRGKNIFYLAIFLFSVFSFITIFIVHKRKNCLNDPFLKNYGTIEAIPLYSDPYKHINGKIGKYKNLSAVLKSYNIGIDNIWELLIALSEMLDLRKIRSNDSYEILVDDKNFIREFTYKPYRSLIFVTAKWNNKNNKYEVFQTQKELKIKYKFCTIKIKDNLYLSAIKNGLPPILVFKIQEILQWDVDFLKDLRNEDVFKIVYSERYSEGKFFDIDRIYGLEYISSNDTLIAVYYENGVNSGYYTPDGRNFSRAFLKIPLKYYKRISSYFSYSRLHPIYKIRRPHYGVDFATNVGTPVLATADGVVKVAGWKGGYGRVVEIKHINGYKTVYAHLSRFAKGVRRGVRVKQGQVIAYSGNSGISTGPHLHYGVYKNGRPIDPLKLQNTVGLPISKKNITLFKSRTRWILDKLYGNDDSFLVKK